jgi:hypothetical protein
MEFDVIVVDVDVDVVVVCCAVLCCCLPSKGERRLGGVRWHEPWILRLRAVGRTKLLGEWVERCVERETESAANERAPY